MASSGGQGQDPTLSIRHDIDDTNLNQAQDNVHWRLYYKFFQSSLIHGCGYVAEGRHSKQGLMWLAIIAVFCGLCANDLYTIITTYLEIPTSVTVDVMHNDTLQFDNVAICFDVFRSSVASTIETFFDEAIFNKSLANLSSMATAAGGPNAFSLTSLPIDDPKWDLVVKATYLMLVSFSDCDNQVFNVPIDNTSIRALELAQNFYLESGFNFFTLAQGVGKYMYSQMLDPSVSCSVQYQSTAITPFCIDVGNISKVVWLAYSPSNRQDDVCLRLDTSTVRLFQHAEDMLYFTQLHVSRASTSPLVWSQPASIPFAVGYGTPELWLDLRGGDGIIDVHYVDSAFWQSDGKSSFAGLEVTSEAIAYNKSTNPCFDYSEVVCAEQCIVNMWMAVNKCWSLVGLGLPGRPANAVPCMSHYPGFNVATTPNNTFAACIRNSCRMPHCSSIMIQYRETQYTSTAMGGSADPMYGTSVTVYQARFIYSLFLEYPSMEFSSLLAAIGGSIGLWLGGSLIAFLHIPVFAVDAVYRTISHHGRVRVIFQAATSTARRTYMMPQKPEELALPQLFL